MTVYLLRHADAGSRGKFTGDDQLRPLNAHGRYQAADLVAVLGQLGLTRIVSSPYRRCIETVAPLAAALGIPIEIHAALAEGPGGPAIELTRCLVDEQAVLCSHGDIIPEILNALVVHDALSLGNDPKCQKASTWILEPKSQVRRAFASASYIPPPR